MPEPLEPRLNEVAAALAGLRPNPPALDRDRLLFNAGRVSVSRPWLWRLTAAASTTLAAVLAAVLLLRPAPPAVERVVYVRVEPPTPPKTDPAPPAVPVESEPAVPPPLYSSPSTPYTRLEDRVLRWGLDGLAEPTPAPPSPPETLDSLGVKVFPWREVTTGSAASVFYPSRRLHLSVRRFLCGRLTPRPGRPCGRAGQARRSPAGL